MIVLAYAVRNRTVISDQVVGFISICGQLRLGSVMVFTLEAPGYATRLSNLNVTTFKYRLKSE